MSSVAEFCGPTANPFLVGVVQDCDSALVEFFNVTDDTIRSLGTNHSDSGIVLKNNVPYPTDGLAYAYMAKILPAYQGGKITQGIASNPAQLTVSTNTTMLLEVTRDNSTLKHTLQGRLVHGGAGVDNKTIHININDTESLPTLQTNSSGYFSREFDLQPENNQDTTYMITATFDGDTPLNATSWAYAVDGQQFAACITIQYGLKPSNNMTVVTVDPRVTELMRAASSPEEMQNVARQNGQLRIQHEFSWWFPWYRLGVEAQVNPSLSYSLDLFGSGSLRSEGTQNKTAIGMETAGNGALTEAGILAAVSTWILLFPEKLTAAIIGGVGLYVGTLLAIAAAHIYSSVAFNSYIWGMLPVLSVALLMTFAYPNPVLWLKSVSDLWRTFSDLPVVSAVTAYLTVYFSLAMTQIWLPPLRGMLSIPIILSMLTIWILIGF